MLLVSVVGVGEGGGYLVDEQDSRYQFGDALIDVFIDHLVDLLS